MFFVFLICYFVFLICYFVFLNCYFSKYNLVCFEFVFVVFLFYFLSFDFAIWIILLTFLVCDQDSCMYSFSAWRDQSCSFDVVFVYRVARRVFALVVTHVYICDSVNFCSKYIYTYNIHVLHCLLLAAVAAAVAYCMLHVADAAACA